MSHLTDEELVTRIVGGDLTAYEQLVSRYQGLVFGVAFHLLRNVEDARDVAQDVFIRAFVRIGQVRDLARLGSWLRQVTVNESRAFIARNKVKGVPLEDRHSVNTAHAVDDRLLVAAALNAIDDTSRLTVILFYLHAYSLKEIGTFLDEPVTTIKSRLRNARGKLRKELEKALERNFGQENLPADFAERVKRILEAAQTGDETTIRELLATEPSLISTAEGPGKHSLLHIAAATGNAAVVELLLANGANPNALDTSDNAIPLHYAAERGWLDVVKQLVEAGSDVNWDRDVHEAGPLGWAVIFGTVQQEVADYLLAHGANMNVFSAIALGREDEVRRLAKEDPTTVNRRMSVCERRQSTIEFATSAGQFGIAEYLADHGAEIGLPEAAALGRTDALAELLRQRNGSEELDRAIKASVMAGQLATTRLLLEHGANADTAPSGTSLVYDALAKNNGDLVRLLVSSGANLEFRDPQWNATPLGWEVFFGRPTGVKLALDLGAQIDAHLLELALSGERGELRAWSSGTPEGYRKVYELLSSHMR